MNYRKIIKLLSIGLITSQIFQLTSGNIDEKYIEVDGIKVLREDFESAQREREKNGKISEPTNHFDLENILESKESLRYSKQLPKYCHVCRLFAEDFISYLKEHGVLKNDSDTAVYSYDEHFAYEAFEHVCDGMKGYRVTRLEQFRYTKGPSFLRQVYNEAQRGSKIKKWVYNTPEEDIDDPTGEIRRLTEKCKRLTKNFRQTLLLWFEQHQEHHLIEWFCKDIYLKNKNQKCLTHKKLDQEKQVTKESNTKDEL